ncbi:MAG: 6-phosphofructokinase, partial [Planctomycetota bacterium]
MPKLRRLGILTGGGDCPGLNAVIRTVAKKAINDHGATIVGVEDGFEGLVHGRTRELTYDDVSGILTRGGTILGTTNRGDPFDLGGRDVSGDVVKNIGKLELDALVCAGGDGTMTIASRLREKGAPVVGVPKTIDNDVVGTDVTFGFDSAVSIVARALDDLHSTADSHGRVLVVEVMGRHAGWIALTGGLAGGADVILLPEIPYDYSAIASYVK